MLRIRSARLLISLLLLGLCATAQAADEKRLVRDAVEVARALRQSDNLYDQFAGAGILVEIGDKDSLQLLVDNLAHPDWSLMRSAIDTLLNVQHPAGLDVIYRYAAATEDGMFMKFLAESCAIRPREDMAEFLVESLELDDVWVRKHALQALAVTPLNNKERRMRAIAEDEQLDPTSRAYAYYALMDTAARDESLSKLIEISDNWGAEAQEAAAVALGLVDNAATRAALEDLRDASTYKVQVAAMVSEAGFGVKEAMQAMADIIINGKGLDPSVAAASVRRLPAPMAARLTESLLACCELSSDVGTRLIEAWARIDADAAPLVEWGLAHDNPDIRMQTIWLVGQRGERRFLDAIAPMLEDADSGVRSMAAWSIVRLIGDKYEPGVEA